MEIKHGATNAFGMGLTKADVKTVIHIQLPKILKITIRKQDDLVEMEKKHLPFYSQTLQILNRPKISLSTFSLTKISEQKCIINYVIFFRLHTEKESTNDSLLI
jgi:hypothetical protein